MSRAKKKPGHAAALKQAFKRLEESDTQLKRRNARKKLRLLLNGIWREADGKYPGMNADGKERSRATSPVCPSCGIPAKTWKALASHALNHHNRYQKVTHVATNGTRGTRTEIVCWCGRQFSNPGSFARHLSILGGRGELKFHTAIEALVNL
jgi:rubrerythrin